MRGVLVAVLLALTALIGVGAGGLPAQAASGGSGTSAGVAAGVSPDVAAGVPPGVATAAAAVQPLGDEVMGSAGDAGKHAHDTVTWLCLCALVAVGILLVARHRPALLTPGRRARSPWAPPWGARQLAAPLRPTDPLTWGVCRR